MTGFSAALQSQKFALAATLSLRALAARELNSQVGAPSRPSLPSTPMTGTLADPFHQYELAAA
jgi:hypothetical protein